MENKGLFITFEGLEGSGKSTQANFIYQILKQADIPVTLTREPGGTAVGEAVRSLLIDPQYKNMDALTEALLFAASRRQHVQELILPKLNRGEVVIADRYIDATLAYQGFGQQLPIESVRLLNDLCARDAQPNLTFYLDITVQTSLERVRQRCAQTGTSPDRLERLGTEFFQRVADGYEYARQLAPKRFVRIDGSAEQCDIGREILARLLPSLQLLFAEQCLKISL